jgi:predicted esterase
MRRRLFSSAAVLALLALTGCGPGASTAGTASAPSPPGTSTAAPAAATVTTRVLPLRDGSRSTDPTPLTRGTDAVPGRLLPTTLFLPSSGGRHPLIVFSHGFGSDPAAYSELLSSWAAAGFVVAAPTFPLSSRESTHRASLDVPNQPADVSFVITSLLALNATAGDPLHGRIDPAHIAVAGHSAGAITTIGLLSTCCADHRIRAAVVLSGSTRHFGTRLGLPAVPAFFVHGLDDDVLRIADDRAVFAATTGPAAFLTLTHGTHSAPYDDDSDPSYPVVRATTTDFLRWALAGDRAALARLRGDAASSGTATLTADRLPH